MDQYDVIEKKNPQFSIKKIVRMMNVSFEKLKYWRSKLGKSELDFS